MSARTQLNWTNHSELLPPSSIERLFRLSVRAGLPRRGRPDVRGPERARWRRRMRIQLAPMRFALFAFCAVLAARLSAGSDAANNILPASPAPTVQTLSLEDCLTIAMQKNHQRPASQFAVAMAEAQHREALAGYWPQIGAKGGWTQLNRAPDFAYPASMMYVPSQTVNAPGGTTSVTIPANAFGPGDTAKRSA